MTKKIETKTTVQLYEIMTPIIWCHGPMVMTGEVVDYACRPQVLIDALLKSGVIRKTDKPQTFFPDELGLDYEGCCG